MSNDAQEADIATLRQQLRKTFSAKTLPRFCHDRPTFRPILDHLGPNYNLHEMIDQVIDYCEQHHLFDQLLSELEHYDPGQYAPAAAYQPPRPLPEFVGREDELGRLSHLLNPGTKTAITGLVGMGGLGKTELAKCAAQQVRNRFRNGVLWADCGEQDTATIADLWAAAYGLRLPGDDPDTKAAAWRALVSNREALLIFDNLQPGQNLEPLLPPTGRSAVLLTTRHSQHPALLGAESLPLDQFSLDEALDLVAELLGRDAARSQIDDATHLFELLGYLPLAVNVSLQLARECNYALAHLHQQLEAAGALAVLGDRERLDKSLNATFELAWHNLAEDLQETFCSLCLFSHGPSFSTEALAATLALEPPEAGARLHRLASRSLLTQEAEARWSLHPLLRDFAATRGPIDHATQARFTRHYQQVARASDARFLQGGDDLLPGLSLFDLEWPHIRAGQAWAAEHAGDDDDAAQLCSDYAGAAVHCLSLRLHPRAWIAWLEAAQQAARRLGDRKAEGAHLGNLGIAYYRLGEVREAIQYHEQALAIAQEIGDRRGEGADLANLGNTYRRLGQVREAIEYYERALAIAQEIGDRRGEGAHLGNLGLAYADLGQVREAIKYHQQALAIAQEIGDRRGEGIRLGNLGSAYTGLGQVREAIEYHQQALAIGQEIGDRRGEGATLANLGIAYYRLGEVREAIEYYEQALVVAQQIGDRRGEGADLGNLGTAYHRLGQVREAIQYHEQALAIAQEIADRRAEGATLANLGLAYESLGDTARARELWAQALVIFEAIEDPNAETVHRLLAELDQ